MKCVNSMATELNIPLARRRTKQEREDVSERWSELSTDESGIYRGILSALYNMTLQAKDLESNRYHLFYDIADLTMIRPVYAPKDFLEVLSSLRNPNYDEST